MLGPVTWRVTGSQNFWMDTKPRRGSWLAPLMSALCANWFKPIHSRIGTVKCPCTRTYTVPFSIPVPWVVCCRKGIVFCTCALYWILVPSGRKAVVPAGGMGVAGPNTGKTASGPNYPPWASNPDSISQPHAITVFLSWRFYCILRQDAARVLLLGHHAASDHRAWSGLLHIGWGQKSLSNQSWLRSWQLLWSMLLSLSLSCLSFFTI